MSLDHDLHLRAAGESDLPAIARLRESVGWGVHDWALRAVIGHPGTTCVVVVDDAGAVVAVGSGIAYGSLGFVGNMVVAESMRRRGLGAAVLQDVIEFLEGHGCRRLELFATAAGRPLYERFGFALTDPSAMVQVSATAPFEPDPATKVAEAGQRELPELTAYDTPRFGGDRGRLLGTMAADPDRPLIVARGDGVIVGYAWLRPDGPRIGPFLAEAPPIAAALLAEAVRRMPSTDTVALHLPTANRAGIEWLRGLGATIEPWDGRMGRGPDIDRRSGTIYGNTVGALG